MAKIPTTRYLPYFNVMSKNQTILVHTESFSVLASNRNNAHTWEIHFAVYETLNSVGQNIMKNFLNGNGMHTPFTIDVMASRFPSGTHVDDANNLPTVTSNTVPGSSRITLQNLNGSLTQGQFFNIGDLLYEVREDLDVSDLVGGVGEVSITPVVQGNDDLTSTTVFNFATPQFTGYNIDGNDITTMTSNETGHVVWKLKLLQAK